MNRNGTFVDETVAARLDTLVQCGSVTAGDFDNDMYVDLYLACRTGASNIANILYHNNGNGTFTALPNAGGAAGPVGLAMSDGVRNGGLRGHARTTTVTGSWTCSSPTDSTCSPGTSAGPTRLFRNNGNSNHWIELDLVGVNSDRDATGARVYATANGRDTVPRPGRALPSLVAGLEAHSLWTGEGHVRCRSTVKWPGGLDQTFPSVAADKMYTVTEGMAPK